ncbi:hypothetical protein AL755_17390 [Arthrobacter sp. ERGS1:01]|nr:hypothetical protein AL755_17390 [Arthrobacter sp. ERGS1:01]
MATNEGHFEFEVGVHPTPELPSTINFLIGNIVTDARSCLDMAIDAIWRNYGLDEHGVQVQFPLEDNFAEKRVNSRKGRGLRTFIDRLDDRFVEVIERAQPNYAGGMLDIPANLSAVFISKLSNANKHRNITPVTLQTVLTSSWTNEPGLKLTVLDADMKQGIPPLRFAVDYDSAIYSGRNICEYIDELGLQAPTALQINFAQRLIVDRQEIPLFPPRFDGAKIEWRAELDDVLSKVPAYIRLTLRNLNRVHSIIEKGTGEFYFLDSNSTL